MITYRAANEKDAAAIALLHAQSWQRHYRGIWKDAFLDGPVIENRMEVWHQRMAVAPENRYILLAESENQLVGFICMFAQYDPQYGAYLDNLHVSSQVQGQGIGKELMRRAAMWLLAHNPSASFFLWVLEKNFAARKFYDAMEGENVELAGIQNPDGSFSDCCRYVWRDLKKLLK